MTHARRILIAGILAGSLLAGATASHAAPEAQTACYSERYGPGYRTAACWDGYGNLAVGVRIGRQTAITSYPATTYYPSYWGGYCAYAQWSGYYC